MSSRFWASSEDMSAESVDSSTASIEDLSRDHPSPPAMARRSPGQEMGQAEERQIQNKAVVQQAIATSSGLPDLQPYQRANLFYLALIEGRCRTQAAAVVNSGRAVEARAGEDHPDVLQLSRHMFDEVRRELVKAGMLSDEFAAGDHPQLCTYLTSFDNILDNIATQQTHNLSARSSQTLSNESGLLALDQDTSLPNISNALVTHQQHKLAAVNLPGSLPTGFNTSLFIPSSSIVPQNFFVTPNDTPMVLTKSFRTLLQHMLPEEDHSKDVSTVSIFATDYNKLCKLGSGAFGKVYKVRHKFDRGEYAVKKIVIRAEKIQKLYDQDNIQELGRLIAEVRTLAKLKHHNIVAYHHCWMEPRPLDEDVSSGSSDDDEDESGDLTRNLTSAVSMASNSLSRLNFDNESALKRDSKVKRRRASSCISAEMSAGFDTGNVYFGEDSIPESKNERSSDNDLQKGSNQENLGNVLFAEDSIAEGKKSGFHKHDQQEENDQEHSEETSEESEESDDDDDDAEEIERSDGRIVKSPIKNLRYADLDLHLYIKMSAYPFSLLEYINQPTENKSTKKTEDTRDITHCYHVGPTVRILLSMLDGIEYIHRKQIIHRDLKPANILFQVLDPTELPTQGYVNISDCKQCSTTTNTKPTWIAPRIGDFGLIHDLSAPTPTSPSGGSSDPAGTPTYLPVGLRKSSPVCPKLDVYSLGIIAFEISYRFGTSTERAMVLDKLKRSGVVPRDFEDHALKECIVNMVKEDVRERWDCAAVRGALERVLGGL